VTVRAALRLPGRGVRAVLLGLLWVYQNAVSPLLGPRCRYYPSCSNYAVQALRTHGAAKGTALAVARVCRCHPWAAGGVDRVPPRGRWRCDPEPPSAFTDPSVVPGTDPVADHRSADHGRSSDRSAGRSGALPAGQPVQAVPAVHAVHAVQAVSAPEPHA